MNGTDWSNSQLPAHTSFVQEDETATTASFLGEPDSTTGVTLLQQELLAGYIAHQALLKSNNLLDLEQSSELTFIPSEIEQDIIITQEPTALSAEQPSITKPILSDVWKARLLLLLSAALYGTNFTFVKALDDTMSVGMSSTLRFGFAAVAMLPCLFTPIDEEMKMLAKERNSDAGDGQQGNILSQLTQFMEEPTRLSVILTGMEIGMYVSIGYIAQALGLQTTTASKSAFICSMAVVTVPILDYIWGKQLLRRQVVGACLAALGVWALEMGGQEAFSDGDMMSLLQPLMFGLGFWKMEAAMEKFPTEAGRLAASQLLMVFIVSFSYLIYSSSPVDNPLPSASDIMVWLQDPQILGMLFWTGIVTTAFTIYMETLALKTLSAAETTLIFSTEPIFGAAFAATVAGESLGMDSVVGAAFIICGCIVSGVDVGRLFTRDKVVDVDA
eukprot:CAMPEP_0172312970 /NCGR_PEP_ID=MMETSP1058-20130122/18934_1 /TAXON_ID=83371 /ORGANISM="Detonula confervacea, Strain CCMP 353" /LENGTH=443 /DNA_ID=CAMNT_0013026539 /DNA_START=382 /DNA_END=1710 /DNA_ORIENTATION=+